MDKIIAIIRSCICLICIFSLWVGCDKKDKPPPTSREITKKIIIDKKDTSKLQLPQKTDMPTSGSKQVTAKPIAKVSPDISKGDVDASKEKQVASISTTTQITDFYNPEGKLDPFAPLIKEKPEALAVKDRKAVRRKLLTPLEKLDLSQLKLVSILRASSGNRALVEEDSGKGYIIKKGTYIGTNSGRVIDILPDKIIIEEEVEDIYGKISIRKKEIELKPPGEE
jgi:type IV pilus assembly protein PilP